MFKKLLIISIFVVGLAQMANAQLAQFKALYIYNFAKNTGWPESDHDKEFIITVIADNELASELDKLSKTRKVGTRSVVVKQAATAAAAETSQIIFLGSSKSAQIGTLVATNNGKKTLLVSDKQGQCSSGASICFKPVDGKLQYEISNNNIKKAGLTIATKIVQLGTEVN